MLLNLLGLGVLIFLAYAFFTLFLRSVRSHHIAVKILGGLLSGLLTLASVVAIVAAFYGLWITSVPRAQPAPDITVTPTPEMIGRGKVLAQSCIPCHSPDGGEYLNGGVTNLAASWGPYGVVYGSNLTPESDVQRWKDGELVRAIRDGVNQAGVPLIGHPRQQYTGMSDADAAALVAYLRSQPALRHDQPRRNLNLLGLWAASAGLLPAAEQPPWTALVGGGG
jgi:mono/diheme cytochrome c family protein